jgi:hypothetical protein
MGVNGSIMGLPIYYNNETLLGVMGRTDEKGNVIITSRTPVSKRIKDALPPNIRVQ